MHGSVILGVLLWYCKHKKEEWCGHYNSADSSPENLFISTGPRRFFTKLKLKISNYDVFAEINHSNMCMISIIGPECD